MSRVRVVHSAAGLPLEITTGNERMNLRRIVEYGVWIGWVAASLASGQQAPAAPRAITVDDAFQVKAVDDPQINADGAWVAYTVETSSLKEDKSRTRVWIAPVAGGDGIAMTVEDETSTHPRWSPDGKYLAFLSGRNEGKTQVYLLNRQGGEAQRGRRFGDRPEIVNSGWGLLVPLGSARLTAPTAQQRR